MFFQGRGNLYLAEVVDGVVGPYKIKICPDSMNVELAVDRWEHINKCGPVDVPDASGDKASSGKVSFSFANVEDANYALAVLGTRVTGGAGSISDEQLPNNIEAGDIWFLGGSHRHRNITSLVIGALVLDTDYTLNAVTGMVRFLTDQTGSPGPTADYTYDDPDFVSMLTAATKEYSAMYEFINKQQANKEGSIELYKLRLSPASNMDYQSDEAQIPALEGTVLADTSKELDDELGQFGRRVL